MRFFQLWYGATSQRSMSHSRRNFVDLFSAEVSFASPTHPHIVYLISIPANVSACMLFADSPGTPSKSFLTLRKNCWPHCTLTPPHHLGSKPVRNGPLWDFRQNPQANTNRVVTPKARQRRQKQCNQVGITIRVI